MEHGQTPGGQPLKEESSPTCILPEANSYRELHVDIKIGNFLVIRNRKYGSRIYKELL